MHSVDLFEVPSKRALRRVAARARQTPPGEWIAGAADAGRLAGRRLPTAADLTPSPDHPVYLGAKSGRRLGQQPGAQTGGIGVSTPDPARVLKTRVMTLVARHIPGRPEQVAEWMAEAQRQAWAAGLTGLHDYDNPSCLVALQILRERGDLGLRVVKQINDPWIEHACELGIRSGFGDEWLRIGAVKMFADGALGRAAYMIAPYEGEPDNVGIAVTDKEAMFS